jgi:hypothetical protein
VSSPGEPVRLAQAGADFGAARRSSAGPLLKPWIEDATFDKVTRVLTVTVRKVPAAGETKGNDWRPNVGRLHFEVRLPIPRHGSDGRFSAPDYRKISIQRARRVEVLAWILILSEHHHRPFLKYNPART